MGGNGHEFPKIVSVDDHVVEPPHLWQTWLPEKYKERGPRGRAARPRSHQDGRTRDLRARDRRERPGRRHLVLRGQDVPAQAPRGRGGLLPRRDGAQADHLRRDAPRLLRAQGARSTTWTSTGSTRRCASRPSPGSAARRSSRRTTRSSRSRACRRTTTGWWRSGAGDTGGALVPLVPRPAVGRGARGRRGAPQRGARRAGGRASPSCRPTSGCRRIHSGYWDPFFAACDETGTVICMHIGSGSKMPSTSPDAPPAVTATLDVRQRRCRRSPTGCFSGVLVRYPNLDLHVLRGPDRVDPVRPRARRRVWEHNAGLGHQRADPRTAEDLLLRPRLRLLLRRPARPRRRSTRSASTRSTFETDYPHTDSTWPHTKEVAEEMSRASTTTSSTRSCAGTRSGCSSSTSPDLIT